MQDGPRELDGKTFRVRVTYHGVEIADPASASPITFHTCIFEDDISYGLYHRVRDEDELWKYCGYQNVCMGLGDSPDVEVNVANSGRFMSIRPGESWITTYRLHGYIWEFPDDPQPGDVFRFVFSGAAVDWWTGACSDGGHHAV